MTKVSETQKYDVVIVRAVLSGLQAAQTVQAAGFEVCVLEAIDRFGGKTLTAKSCEKGFNDLGASWINDTNQSEMFKLYQKYGLETEIQRDCGDTLIQSVGGNTVKVPYGQLPVCFAFFFFFPTRENIESYCFVPGGSQCSTGPATGVSRRMLSDQPGQSDRVITRQGNRPTHLPRVFYQKRKV